VNILPDGSIVKCGHGGIVSNQASQKFVKVQGMPVLIADDPIGRSIVACPNYGIGRKPCTTTRAVRTGYSGFVSISGHPVCLDTLEGVTDGVDVQVVLYTVINAEQTLVTVAS
jgi:hypothetical protein